MITSDRFKEAKQAFQQKQEQETIVFASQLRKKKIDSRFNEDWYFFKGKFLKFFSRGFWRYDIYNKNKELLFSVGQKIFKLREDIRVYTDDKLQNETLRIKTKEIIDVWSTYEIYDSSTDEIIGFLKCRGLLRGHWIILSADKIELARLKERTGFAIVGYFLGRWLPRQYDIKTKQGQKIAEVKQKFNPFVARYILKIEKSNVIDSRLLVAAGILLMIITFQRKG